MELAGGAGFYRSAGLERRFRDIQAARYHPLQAGPQAEYAGAMALGLPVDTDFLSGSLLAARRDLLSSDMRCGDRLVAASVMRGSRQRADGCTASVSAGDCLSATRCR